MYVCTVCTHVCVCQYVSMSVWVDVWMCVCVYVYVCMRACVHACMRASGVSQHVFAHYARTVCTWICVNLMEYLRESDVSACTVHPYCMRVSGVSQNVRCQAYPRRADHKVCRRVWRTGMTQVLLVACFSPRTHGNTGVTQGLPQGMCGSLGKSQVCVLLVLLLDYTSTL